MDRKISVCMALLLLTIFTAAGCSGIPGSGRYSGPELEPYQRVDEAISFYQALDFCAENKSIFLPAGDVWSAEDMNLQLKRWRRCFERVYLKFNEAAENERFVSFFRILKTNPPAEVNKASALSFIHDGTAAVKDSRIAPPPGWISTSLASAIKPDSELNEVVSFVKAKQVLCSNKDIQNKNRNFCTRLNDLKVLVSDLSELNQYQANQHYAELKKQALAEKIELSKLDPY